MRPQKTHSKYSSYSQVKQGTQDVIDLLAIGHCSHCIGLNANLPSQLYCVLKGTLRSKIDFGKLVSYIFPVSCPQPPQMMILEKLNFMRVFVGTNKMVNRFSPTDLHLVCNRLYPKHFQIFNISLSHSVWRINFFLDSLLLEGASSWDQTNRPRSCCYWMLCAIIFPALTRNCSSRGTHKTYLVALV